MTTNETVTETVPCTRVQAKNLLRMSANNNGRDGLIGSPDTVTGRTLSGSLSLMDRLTDIHLTRRNGWEILTGTLPGHGAHNWYINRESIAADPWSA
jgi:hypothetical protein